VALHRGIRAAVPRTFATKAEARAVVAAWIEEYNHDRRHSALGMGSRVDDELALAGKDAA
jgi:putative transposase